MEQEKVWDAISEKWAEFRVRISPTVENFLKNKNGKILDVGCGSGRNFLNSKNLKWHGTDFSKEMIKHAKKRAGKLQIEVELKKADGDNIPFEDNYFDVVLCYAVLHCIKSPAKRKKTLEEIFRIMKPGAEALISVWGKKSPRLKNKEKECFVPWTIKENEGKQNRYTYLFDLEELEKLAEEVGFKILKSWEERNVNLIVRKSTS